VILPETGGAARDIHTFWTSGRLPAQAGSRSKEYVDRAKVLMPEIAKRGGCHEPWTRGTAESAAFYKSAGKSSMRHLANSLLAYKKYDDAGRLCRKVFARGGAADMEMSGRQRRASRAKAVDGEGGEGGAAKGVSAFLKEADLATRSLGKELDRVRKEAARSQTTPQVSHMEPLGAIQSPQFTLGAH